MFLISDKGITYFGRETNLILLRFKLPITAETTAETTAENTAETSRPLLSKFDIF